jgi:hypothetical protein
MGVSKGEQRRQVFMWWLVAAPAIFSLARPQPSRGTLPSGRRLTSFNVATGVNSDNAGMRASSRYRARTSMPCGNWGITLRAAEDCRIWRRIQRALGHGTSGRSNSPLKRIDNDRVKAHQDRTKAKLRYARVRSRSILDGNRPRCLTNSPLTKPLRLLPRICALSDARSRGGHPLRSRHP